MVMDHLKSICDTRDNAPYIGVKLIEDLISQISRLERLLTFFSTELIISVEVFYFPCIDFHSDTIMSA